MPSTVIASYSYSNKEHVLRIVFQSGSVYDYLHVPQKIFQALKAATSKGTYLNQHIKGHFPYRQVNDIL
ncbi:KTSC domain-containing protein [Chitinophaga dinghuensis]|uniref:KTSC domain-containing protein n=1 Tax=Chitinophaga dinghuensis TaxID=1539050 RepID=UPI000DB91267|nr:KTSC domain-containing protein [Chitinophaga dinghuensis]